MTFGKILLGGMVTLLSVAPAFADYYPSTVSQEERERHEFVDVQKENFPSGEAPAYTSSQKPENPQMPKSAGWASPYAKQPL